MSKYMVLVSCGLGSVGDLLEMEDAEATRINAETYGFPVLEKQNTEARFLVPREKHPVDNPIEAILAMAKKGLTVLNDKRAESVKRQLDSMSHRRAPVFLDVDAAPKGQVPKQVSTDGDLLNVNVPGPSDMMAVVEGKHKAALKAAAEKLLATEEAPETPVEEAPETPVEEAPETPVEEAPKRKPRAPKSN